jgi:Na+/H+ antiporter NhaD/arsenite permease-like protein
MTNAPANPHADHAGFHGPKCWVVSAIVGVLLGFVLSLVLPAQLPAPAKPGAAEDHPVQVVVVETRPDQTQHIRWPDESTTSLSAPFRPDDPDSIRNLQAAISNAPTNQAHGEHGAVNPHAAEPVIPLALCVPFALLLLSIALMPFINEHFWHKHFPDFAFLLGSMVLTYFLVAFGSWGKHEMLHAGIEYYSFIALVGGLYVASGGILIDIRFRGRASTNTALLAFGAIMANIVGTTGASVLLIRPFMRMNHGRLRPLHVVFFVFIVSNCGGCLTPIGDPPLYLGYLKGVPFFWTLTHLWPMWLVTNGLLLAMFFVYDLRVPQEAPNPDTAAHGFDRHEHPPVIAGWSSLGFLALLVAGVFVDPALKKFAPGGPLEGLPIGATFQIMVAITAFITAKPSIRHANQFTFAPVKEVGFLFVGIFLTMAPALAYLRANAMSFGIESPSQFYFGTGTLSAFLDNAPTYISFGQVALGVLHLPLTPPGLAQFIANTFDIVHLPAAGTPPSPAALAEAAAATVHSNGQLLLEAISLGAVFFGAMTYIGNGPNFMVKSIVESAYRRGRESPLPTGDDLGVAMPSFFGYLLYGVLILLPVLVVNWLLFIR